MFPVNVEITLSLVLIFATTKRTYIKTSVRTASLEKLALFLLEAFFFWEFDVGLNSLSAVNKSKEREG